MVKKTIEVEIENSYLKDIDASTTVNAIINFGVLLILFVGGMIFHDLQTSILEEEKAQTLELDNIEANQDFERQYPNIRYVYVQES